MANPPSRDALCTELERRGLPPAYIERLLGELDDHYNDLLEERSSSMGAARKLDFETDDLQKQVGEPTKLAIFAAEQYRARSFWGRHPIVTFVLGPLPLLVAMWAAYLTMVWGIAGAISFLPDGWVDSSAMDHPYAQATVFAFFTWGIFVLVPLATGLVLCRIYRRNALQLRWPVIGCVLLALLISFVTFRWTLATGPNEGERGTIMVGLEISTSITRICLSLLPKFASALGVGLLLVKRSQQKLKLAT